MVREKQRQGCPVKDAAGFSLLEQALQALSRRVVEIELRSGERETPVSYLAADITYHEGARAFAGILAALQRLRKDARAQEIRTRNDRFYDVRHRGAGSGKRAVLLSLLRASAPAEGDDARSLCCVLREAGTAGDGETISEQALAEAAMYVPAWTHIVAEYLGWPGLLGAICFLRVHTGQGIVKLRGGSSLPGNGASPSRGDGTGLCQGEGGLCQEGAGLCQGRVKPCPGEEFFDVSWLRSVCQTLGEERFYLLLNAAEGTGTVDAGIHARLRLFVDAALNKIPLEKLYREAAEQRRTDRILCLSLAPLQEDAAADVSKRYD